MNSELRELYQEVILDHNRNPRNFRQIAGADRHADGFNPLCGDKVTVYLRMDGDRIEDVSFQGSGCAISTASASMLTEVLRGKTEEEVLDIVRRFHRMVTSDPSCPAADPSLGKLTVFAGVCEFPARVKCATLVWHTLKTALERGAGAVSTE